MRTNTGFVGLDSEWNDKLKNLLYFCVVHCHIKPKTLYLNPLKNTDHGKQSMFSNGFYS